MAAFNFPSSPSEGQTYTDVASGAQYVFKSPVWMQVSAAQIKATALPRNRVVNPCMQISQENGDTVGTTTGFYAADQWYGGMTAGIGMQTSRTGGPTPNGSNYMASMKITTAKGTLVAADFAGLMQQVEGIRVADFRWGMPDAKPAVLRFCVYSSFAGTFSVALNNATWTRSFVKSFTIAAGEINTYKYITIPVPGDTSGTWLINNGKGVEVCFTMAAGSTYVTATEGAWQAGNKYQVTGSTNGAGTLNNQIWFSDVGLYLDPDATGVAPKWEMPDEAEELLACQRYYFRDPTTSNITGGYNTAGANLHQDVQFKVVMRGVPAVVAIGASTVNATGPNLGTTGPSSFRYSVTITGAGTGYAMFGYSASARM